MSCLKLPAPAISPDNVQQIEYHTNFRGSPNYSSNSTGIISGIIPMLQISAFN